MPVASARWPSRSAAATSPEGLQASIIGTTVMTGAESSALTQDKKDHESAAELLADWRSAERDNVAAHSAAAVAKLALEAASAAEEAASEVETAANAALEAVERARAAAGRARAAALRAAEAAQMAVATAEGDAARATQTIEESERAETEARERFHDAEQQGFPKA